MSAMSQTRTKIKLHVQPVTSWHLIIEADDSECLSLGVKGLEVRLARGLNRLAGRRGRVFKHRYDVKILGTPGQVRATLLYVLANARKHAGQVGVRIPPFWIDPM